MPTGDKAFDVFLSHSSHNKLQADAICAKLEEAGFRCWVAPRNISPGREFAAAIVEGVDQCRAMVLVFSKHANDSEHVLREVVQADNRKLKLIPFRVEDIKPTDGMAYYLSGKHWLDAFDPPFERHIAELINSLCREFGLTGGLIKLKKPPEIPLPPRKPRWLVFAPAGLVVLAVAIAFWWPKPVPISKENPFVNSLGMKFVPVEGTGVLFSIWETRVGDFRQFAQETNYKVGEGMLSLDTDDFQPHGFTWENPGPGFTQTADHPVVGVSWQDAHEFCEWLNKREHKSGKINEAESYALPDDWQWSKAVGLPSEIGATPEERSRKIPNIYPWDGPFPPSERAGNYAGRESQTGHEPSNWTLIQTIKDDFARTAPVGKFDGNRFGLFDLGGNAWELCETQFAPPGDARVVRGASWAFSDKLELLSSQRSWQASERRFSHTGFRQVLVGSKWAK